MRTPWIFGVVTFFAAWLVQVLLMFFPFPASASPHFLLLCTLALGAMGMTGLAQTLGFFWGLSLDVFGASLFGAQGLLLTLAGFLAGSFSRQLNAEKLVAQETLALTGTVFYWIGFCMIDDFFRPAAYHRDIPVLTAALQFLFNAAAAPVVFWAADRWTDFWSGLLGEPVRRV